ncbi:hypothetical protein Q5752_003491 [Cryptotrichosporon argae]
MVRKQRRIVSDDEMVIVLSDSESDAYDSEPDEKPKRKAGVKRKRVPAKATNVDAAGVAEIEDAGMHIRRPHGSTYHAVETLAKLQNELLAWFEGVRERRGMPWRKRYDPSLSMEEKGQRAYEIWVSEVMLQQTQVATVIDYWRRWIERWPTIADLAKADLEEVNAAWRGLGYYRRARSLLAGAKTVMGNSKYQGRLPSQPDVLEKEIDGVGRYTAGAICSMAYGVQTPIVDGNIHRLFTRLLAVHAPQTAPATIKFLWAAATELVERLPSDGRDGVAGDWNQALMELGSQVCKPAAPECAACPLQAGCKAYAELSHPPVDDDDTCSLCAPIPSVAEAVTIPSVTVFPMRKPKKASREEEEVVSVTEWRGEGGNRWLFTKRPEKGLLAGLFEPPTTPVPAESSVQVRLQAALASLSTTLGLPIKDLAPVSHVEVATVPHIFSHINMTYHVHHLVMSSAVPPPPALAQAVWLDTASTEHANVGTGVKKVWAEVYGAWGSFEPGRPKAKAGAKKKQKTMAGAKAAAKVAVTPGETVVRKVMMPTMPVRKRE